jgi:hypothetical protein
VVAGDVESGSRRGVLYPMLDTGNSGGRVAYLLSVQVISRKQANPYPHVGYGLGEHEGIRKPKDEPRADEQGGEGRGEGREQGGCQHG